VSSKDLLFLLFHIQNRNKKRNGIGSERKEEEETAKKEDKFRIKKRE
jgi:hypothetical protein